MKLYADDIDNNGKIDPVLFYYIKDEDGKRKLYPSINRDQLSAQVPALKSKFSLNKDYAKATPDEIFTGSKHLQILICNETRSCWFENKGNPEKNGTGEQFVMPCTQWKHHKFIRISICKCLLPINFIRRYFSHSGTWAKFALL